jgi:hypothetical protein
LLGIKFIEGFAIFLIVPVLEPKEKNEGPGISKGVKDLPAKSGVIGEAYGRTAFQLFADVLQDIALNVPVLFIERGVNEKKVVRDRVAGKKNMVERGFSGRCVGKGDIVGVIVISSVHDQTVRNVFAQEISERQVHAEHIFAEAAAGPAMADAIRGNDELVPSRKEPVPFGKRFIAVSAAQVSAGDSDKIVQFFVGFAVQLDFMDHGGHYSKQTRIFKWKNGIACRSCPCIRSTYDEQRVRRHISLDTTIEKSYNDRVVEVSPYQRQERADHAYGRNEREYKKDRFPCGPYRPDRLIHRGLSCHVQDDGKQDHHQR